MDGEILGTCEQGFFGLVGGVSLDPWTELLQTRGRSFFRLIGRAQLDSVTRFIGLVGRVSLAS